MQESNKVINGPHKGQPVYNSGESLETADAAVVMLHGRGATAMDILSLAAEWTAPGFAYLAPQAANNTWYPYRFMELTISNEPWLSSALSIVARIMQHLKDAGITPEKTVLLGFSQGACLALEYAARNAARYGGIVGLSGGVIGADGEPRQDKGNLQGTPVFLGCSDIDPHIPKERVMDTAALMESLGGKVSVKLYPNMEHTVNQDEISIVKEMLHSVHQEIQ
jgi:phospholipase/carboxylesterase